MRNLALLLLFGVSTAQAQGLTVFYKQAVGEAPPASEVTHDATTPLSAVENGNLSTFDIPSHTVAANDNRVSVVVIGEYSGAGGDSVSTVVRDGQSFTKLGTYNYDANNKIEMWYLVAPNTGAAVTTVTMTAFNYFEISAGISTYYNVDQSTPLTGFVTNTGTGTTASVDVPNTASTDLVVDGVYFYTADATVDESQDERWRVFNASFMGSGSSTEAGDGSTVTMSWGLGSSIEWQMIGARIQVAP